MLLSLGAMTVVAATYAALSKPVHPSAASANLSASVASHKVEYEKYLEQMHSYLRTPPRDGVFGADRIPNLHGKFADNLPAFKAIAALQGTVQMRSAVIGFQPVKYSKVEGEDAQQLPDNKDDVRITPVHLLTPNLSLAHNGPNMLTDDGKDASSAAWSVGVDELRRFAVKLRDKPKETYSEQGTVLGKPSWLVAKAVHASENSCYKCHTNIKKGQPIGYVVAMVSDAKS